MTLITCCLGSVFNNTGMQRDQSQLNRESHGGFQLVHYTAYCFLEHAIRQLLPYSLHTIATASGVLKAPGSAGGAEAEAGAGKCKACSHAAGTCIAHATGLPQAGTGACGGPECCPEHQVMLYMQWCVQLAVHWCRVLIERVTLCIYWCGQLGTGGTCRHRSDYQ